MPAPPTHSGEGRPRLERCIRDLVALNALPSCCVGKTPSETLQLVLEALPTALDCPLLYLQLPGQPPREVGRFRGAPLTEAQLAEIRAVTVGDAEGLDSRLFLEGGALWCLEAQ